MVYRVSRNVSINSLIALFLIHKYMVLLFAMSLIKSKVPVYDFSPNRP